MGAGGGMLNGVAQQLKRNPSLVTRHACPVVGRFWCGLVSAASPGSHPPGWVERVLLQAVLAPTFGASKRCSPI